MVLKGFREIRGTVPAGKKHVLVQQVSLWLEDEKRCFGQVAVKQKGNEITAIPALLEAVYCKGATITRDAMGCQKKIYEKIKGRALLNLLPDLLIAGMILLL